MFYDNGMKVGILTSKNEHLFLFIYNTYGLIDEIQIDYRNKIERIEVSDLLACLPACGT